jgi:hypothetical protein
MSIDQLLSSRHTTEGDPIKNKKICQEILKDYLGTVAAYVPLAQKVQIHPEKVECLCEIMKQVIMNMLGINTILKNMDRTPPEDTDKLVGQILHGEHYIEELIEKFEHKDT